MRIAPSTLLLLLVALALPVAAETLEQAWASALVGNPALAAGNSQRAAAQARQKSAQALDMPSMDLSATTLHWASAPRASLDSSAFAARFSGSPLATLLPSSFDAPLTARDAAVVSLSVSYPLYSGGRIEAAQGVAAAGVSLAEASARSLQQTLKLAVAEAYLNVLRADAAQRVAQDYLSSVEAHRADVIAMEKQGVAARVEHLTADVAVADARRRQIEAERAISLSRAAYNRLLARDLDAPVALASLAVLPPTQLPAQLPERALAQRGELAALSAGQSALIARARALRGESRPQVALKATQLQWHGLPLAQNHASVIGVVLSWSVFDGGLNQQQVAALLADAQAAADQHADATALVLLDVRRAQLEETSAAERARSAAAGDSLAAEALHLTRSRYGNGLATQTEVLAAQTRVAEARRAVDDAQFDIQLARLRLRRAIGEL